MCSCGGRVPYDIAGSSWEAEEERYVQHLLSICDRFAPGECTLYRPLSAYRAARSSFILV